MNKISDDGRLLFGSCCSRGERTFYAARVMKMLMVFGVAGSMAVGAAAQSVLFDFENAPANHQVPFNLTVGGITASFSKTGLGGFYVDLPQNITGVIPAGFSGLCLDPTSIYAADLVRVFSKKLADFSILYAAQELACDSSATMQVTAYLDGALAGSVTTNATAFCPCTWQSQTWFIGWRPDPVARITAPSS